MSGIYYVSSSGDIVVDSAISGELVDNSVDEFNPDDYKLIPIDGNDNYFVNDKGDVYSLSANKVLSKAQDDAGYVRVTLCIKGKYIQERVHRLVGITLIPNPENKAVINHINGNKNDNYIENLEWTTQSENIIHAIETGLYVPKGRKKK